LFPLNYNL